MRYIALLRGINVGGNTMIKMADLKGVFERCGFSNVATYINSGNVAFDGGQHVGTGSYGSIEGEMATRIEKAIEAQFAKTIPVIFREQPDLRRIIEGNPYAGQFESHKEMHVLFLKEEMSTENREQLLAAAPEGERFAVVGREIYCHLPMGVADSLLGKSFIEKKLKLAVTGRNWRTVDKLSHL
ncbi:MAG: DUF1697 domain-containing protein [Pyrinomonadaceae bacterium]